MPNTNRKYIKMAISAMELARRKHAFDANLYKAGVRSIRTEKAHDEYEKWTKAIEAIEAIERDTAQIRMSL